MSVKSFLLLEILGMGVLFIGCAGRQPLSPEMQRISSVSDTNNCKFLQTMYTETQPYNLTYYLKLNTYNAGGDSYKIIATNSQMVMGLNVLMTNFEVYKCK